MNQSSVSLAFSEAQQVLQPFSTYPAQVKINAVRTLGLELPHPEAVKALSDLFTGGCKKTSSAQNEALGLEAGKSLSTHPDTLPILADKIHLHDKDLESAMYALECIKGALHQTTVDALAATLKSKDSKLLRKSFEVIESLVAHPQDFMRMDLSEFHSSLFTLAFDASIPRDISNRAHSWFVDYASDDVVDGLADLLTTSSQYDDQVLEQLLLVLTEIRSPRAEEQLMRLFQSKSSKISWLPTIATSLAGTSNEQLRQAAQTILRDGQSFKDKLSTLLSKTASDRREMQIHGAKVILGLAKPARRESRTDMIAMG